MRFSLTRFMDTVLGVSIIFAVVFAFEHVAQAHYRGLEHFSQHDTVLPLVTAIKTADQANAQPGEIVTYTITVINWSDTAANNIAVVDYLNFVGYDNSPVYEENSAVPSENFSLITKPGSILGSMEGQTLQWFLPHIEPGETVILKFKARVAYG